MSRALAIAGHFQKHQMVGGVASVFQNLTRGIDELIATDSRYHDLAVTVFHGPAGVPYRSPRFEYRETSGRFGRFAAESRLAARYTSGYEATLFPNYFTPPLIRSKRAITILHDLLHLHFPDVVPAHKRLWLAASHQWTLRRADAVVTITQAVKDDVVRRYGDRWADRVVPIWNPIAIDRLEGDATQQLTAGRPYILGVAVDRPSKNLHSLVRAYKLLRDRLPDYCLVLAGELRSRRPAREQQTAKVGDKLPSAVELVRDLGLERDVIATGFISDAELGALYRGASLFVLPSLFEGFGMPPIEAMSLGAPALVSDIAPLREITMGHAHYLEDPTNPAEMADRIALIVEQGAAAKPTAEVIGMLRETFAPATIAAKYLDVLLGNP